MVRLIQRCRCNSQCVCYSVLGVGEMNIIDNILIVILIATSVIGTAVVYGYEESFEDEPYETNYVDDEWEDTFDECTNCPVEKRVGSDDDDNRTTTEEKCKGKECGKGKGKDKDKPDKPDKPPKPPKGGKKK